MIQALGSDREAVRTWRTYHLISDAMRESRLLSADFAARLAGRWPPSRRCSRRARGAVPHAVAHAGSRCRRRERGRGGAGGLDGASRRSRRRAPRRRRWRRRPEPKPKPAIVPLPSTANDYLLAHQGFSPRVSLQGMAPYVRTVAEQAVEPRR